MTQFHLNIFKLIVNFYVFRAVGSMISTLFYPLVTFVMVTIVVGFWALTALFLASAQEPVYRWVDSSNPRPDDSPHNVTCLPGVCYLFYRKLYQLSLWNISKGKNKTIKIRYFGKKKYRFEKYKI